MNGIVLYPESITTDLQNAWDQKADLLRDPRPALKRDFKHPIYPGYHFRQLSSISITCANFDRVVPSTTMIAPLPRLKGRATQRPAGIEDRAGRGNLDRTISGI